LLIDHNFGTPVRALLAFPGTLRPFFFQAFTSLAVLQCVVFFFPGIAGIFERSTG
jgi:hypothetical protein